MPYISSAVLHLTKIKELSPCVTWLFRSQYGLYGDNWNPESCVKISYVDIKKTLSNTYAPRVGVVNGVVLDGMTLLLNISFLLGFKCVSMVSFRILYIMIWILAPYDIVHWSATPHDASQYIGLVWVCVFLVLSVICVPFTNSLIEFHFIMLVVTMIWILWQFLLFWTTCLDFLY